MSHPRVLLFVHMASLLRQIHRIDSVLYGWLLIQLYDIRRNPVSFFSLLVLSTIHSVFLCGVIYVLNEVFTLNVLCKVRINPRGAKPFFILGRTLPGPILVGIIFSLFSRFV